jgi:propionyl-CoA carboxylase beta chain
MGAKPAVGIIHRRELAASEDPEATRDELADLYAEHHLRPNVAAAHGQIDELIEPRQTRSRVAWALRTMERAG